MKTIHASLGATLCLAIGIAVAAGAPTSDAAFVIKASAGGLAEVKLGNIGVTVGTEASVKSFAQEMVRDHTEANEKLKSLAESKGMKVARSPMPADEQAAKRIVSLKSDAFNTAFATKMVADHKKTIALFQTEADSGKDPDLKAFAADTLPKLKHHLEMAQALPGAPSK